MCACARSVSVSLRVSCHIDRNRCLSQQHHRRRHRKGIQTEQFTIQHSAVKTKPTSCNKTCFPSTHLLGQDVTVVHSRRTVIRTVDARPCVRQTRLTHQHCTTSDQSSCVSKYGLLNQACGNSGPFRLNKATCCSSAVWFRQITKATTQLVLMRIADHGASRPRVSYRALPFVHLLEHTRIAHLPTAWIPQARNPAAKSHDVVVKFGRLRSPARF